MFLRDFFNRSLSLGIYSEMSEGKKFAMRVATMDAYWSFVAFVFYVCYTFINNLFPIFYVHLVCLCLITISIVLIRLRYHDVARYIIHFAGLGAIYMCSDSAPPSVGYEFYYFGQVMVPHISWSLDEAWWKAGLLSMSAGALLVIQQMTGTGIFLPVVEVPPEEKIIALVFVVLFTLTILVVARWKLFFAQQEIKEQQEELIHSSNLKALGEMAGGISHEINNPLQTLSLQVTIVREKFKDLNTVPENIQQNLNVMDETIFKVGRMVQGLRDLSRKDTFLLREEFHFSKVLEDILIVSSERLKERGIALYIYGDVNFRLQGSSVQISQVMMNLLNNAVDAVAPLKEKWIRLDIVEKRSFLQVSITDSGEGIPKEISSKMMNPFFSTKESSKGMGLGLSISKSIIEKNHGSLYYDQHSPHTRFVILLPYLAEEKV